MNQARFTLGKVVATRGALELMKTESIDGLALLSRHVRGDWGDLDEQDKQENELSLKDNFRILSAYGKGEEQALDNH
jgi:hypothetical protein